MIEKLSDGQLWDAVRKSDLKALDNLFDRYYFDLVRSGIVYCQDSEASKDAANDIFFNLWKNREQLADVSNVRAYLFMMYRNQLATHFRKNKDRRDNLHRWKEIAETCQSSYEQLLIDTQAETEKKEKLRKALKLLTSKQKEYLEYKYFEGLSYQEITEKTGVSMKTLYNTIHEAVKTLREKLAEEKKI